VKREEGTCLQRGKEKRKKKVHLCRVKKGRRKEKKKETQPFPTPYLMLMGEITGGGFETLKKDITICFISKTTSLHKIANSQTLTLYFSLVFLSFIFHTQ